MMSRQKHVWHALIPEDLWPGVVRMIQVAIYKGVLVRRGIISKRAWKSTCHGVHECHGRNLAPREHKITKAHLNVNALINKALINSLVTSADKRPLAPRRIMRPCCRSNRQECGLDPALIEHLAGGREQNHRARYPPRLRGGLLGLNHRGLQGFSQHDHARPTAVGTVIDCLVDIVGKTTWVDEVALHQAP